MADDDVAAYATGRILDSMKQGGLVLDLTPPSPEQAHTPLPQQVLEMTGLRALNLSGLDLSWFPAKIGTLMHLEKLVITDAVGLRRTVPVFLWSLEALQHLDLTGNGFKKLPPGLARLSRLEELDLSQNSLSSLPAEVGQLKKLKRLVIDHNDISALPKELGLLSSLRELHACENSMTLLPLQLGDLRELHTLRVDGNRLASIPAQVGLLTNLVTFSARQNHLVALPHELALLPKLVTLDVFGNRLGHLPVLLGRLNHTLSSKSNFAGNKYTHPALQERSQDSAEMLAYLQRLLPGEAFEARHIDLLIVLAVQGTLLQHHMRLLTRWLDGQKLEVIQEYLMQARHTVTRSSFYPPLEVHLKPKERVPELSSTDARHVADIAISPVKVGLVHKQGSFKAWQKRWLSIQGPYVYLMSSENNTAHSHAILLSSIQRVEALQPEDGKKQRYHTFAIFSHGHSLVLALDQASDRDEWISTLMVQRKVALSGTPAYLDRNSVVVTRVPLAKEGARRTGGGASAGRRTGGSKGSVGRRGRAGSSRSARARAADQSRSMAVEVLLENSICIMCSANLRDVVLVPCHHLLYCSSCLTPEFKACPSCSTAIQTRVVCKTKP